MAGRLAAGIDKAVADHKAASCVPGYVSERRFERPGRRVVKWGHAACGIDLGILRTDGPPSYKLARDADVTVILYANAGHRHFAFRDGN